ncbi:hypothetical protein K7G98_00710 [Saccharothrix sp. MB29]|nr:hypothetical protein [Saccharothrix sp. MB29]
MLAGALPAGVRAEPASGMPADSALEFRVSQGGYKALAALHDDQGGGSVLVVLEKPEGREVTCDGRSGCELVDLPSGRKAAVTTLVEGDLRRLLLHARAADGTSISVHASNDAEGDAATRPTPPLTVADLVRIADLPDLRW